MLWRNQLGCRAQENEEAGVNDVGLCTCLPVDRPCQLWQLTGSQTINNQSLPLWIMLFFHAALVMSSVPLALFGSWLTEVLSGADVALLLLGLMALLSLLLFVYCFFCMTV